MKWIMARDYTDMSRKAANIVSAQVLLKEDSVLGLATGSTPIGLYKQLIAWQHKDDISFDKVTTVNLDEYRNLSPEDPQSYRHFMNEQFFSQIDIRMENTNVPNSCCADVMRECLRYDAMIENRGGIDLQLIGIGNNGHIGFNEPGEAFIMETHLVDLSPTTIKANARFFDGDEQKVPKQAITMGIKHIMQAKRLLLVASGNAKMEVVKKALSGPVTPRVPASILQLHKDLTVVCCPDA